MAPDTHGAEPQAEHHERNPAFPRPPTHEAITINIDDVPLMEAKLRQEEQELGRIVDLIPQTIVVLNPNGKAIYANRVALEYRGLSLDGVRADEFRARVFHSEDIQKLRENRQKGLSQTVPFENEQRAFGKDGRYRWFLIRYDPLFEENGKVIRWYVTGTDIEDRKPSCDLSSQLQDTSTATRRDSSWNGLSQAQTGDHQLG